MTESVNAGYADVDRTPDPGSFVRQLDRMTGSDQVHASKQRTFALLDLRPGSSVLDLGCGTGDDVRALGELVGPRGRVVGVDKSRTMVEEAERRAADLGLPIEYRVADASALAFPDDSFDACRIDRVLHHVADPRAVVAEAVRVLRSGGRLAIHEPDFETLVLDAPDRVVTRKLLNFFCDSHEDGWAGRRLYGLATRAGLVDLAVEPINWLFTEYADAQAAIRLERTVALATEQGIVPAEEGRAWLAGLRAASGSNCFFMACTNFLVGGRKP
jgi:ubiquinone/menaquinone biosynthesis C-methylase UbiE